MGMKAVPRAVMEKSNSMVRCEGDKGVKGLEWRRPRLLEDFVFKVAVNKST